jgi:hypothetical protein
MTTYYIDYANGSDTAPGDGSSAHPWQTLAKFHTACANGDTCRVRGSDAPSAIYRVSLSITKNNLTIEADAGHTPVIASSTTLTGWALSGGYTSTYEVTTGAAMFGGCYNGSEFLAPVADVATVEATPGSCVKSGGKIYVHLTAGGAPTSVEALNVDGTLYISGTGNTIRGIIFQWNGGGVIGLTAANNTVDGCTFRYIGTWSPTAVWVTAAGCTVSNCTSVLIKVDSEAGGSAVKAQAGAAGLTISNGVFTGGGIPIVLQAGSGHVVTETICQNSAQQSLYFQGDAAGVVSGCTFKNGSYGTVRGDIAHSGTVTIHHTLIYFGPDVSTVGPHMKTGIHLHGANSTWNIYHCVFAYLDSDGLAFYVQPDGAPTTITLRAKNNIFYNCVKGIFYDTEWAQVVSDLDYNCFYGNATANFQNVPVGDRGTHNVMSDPLFTAPTASPYRDLRLSPGSPCIDAGLMLAGINDGTGGSAVHRGFAPDMGAFETVPPKRNRRIARDLGIRMGI